MVGLLRRPRVAPLKKRNLIYVHLFPLSGFLWDLGNGDTGRKGRSRQTAATATDMPGSSNGRGTGSPIPILDQESELENNGEESSKTVNAHQILDEMRENEPDKRTTTNASLVELDEGSALRYVPLTVINCKKYTKIERKDVEQEVDYWSTLVLCCVLRSNPPVDVINGFVHRIWADLSIDKVMFVKKGIFLVRFSNLEDQSKVLKRGWYFFDNKPFVQGME